MIDIKYEKVTITPEMALKWLANNPKNRQLKGNTVNRYVEDIKAGRWKVNGESIKFDPEGNLLDGQHRLSAIVKAGRSIVSQVARNVPPDSFDTIDTGRGRTASDVFYIEGEKNVTDLAAACRIVHAYESGSLKNVIRGSRHSHSTTQQMEYILRKHPSLRDSVGQSFACRKNGIIQVSIVAAMHLLFSKFDAELANDFLQRLATGGGLVDGHPVLALRNRLIRDKEKGVRGHNQVNKIALVIKAWNKLRNGEQVFALTWNPSKEAFPEIE